MNSSAMNYGSYGGSFRLDSMELETLLNVL